jgi:hypothetical protein
MEEFKSYIVQNWPTIVEYAIMVVAYFLFFLYRAKVSGTKRDLTVMFKEKAQEVTNTDLKLREDVGQTRKVMSDELAEAKRQYQAAVDEISDLKARLNRAEKALIEIIADEVENIVEVPDDGEQSNNEED